MGAQVLHPRNYAANGAGALVFRSSMYDGLPAERVLLVDECEEQKVSPPKLEQGCVICSKEKGVDEKLNVCQPEGGRTRVLASLVIFYGSEEE